MLVAFCSCVRAACFRKCKCELVCVCFKAAVSASGACRGCTCSTERRVSSVVVDVVVGSIPLLVGRHLASQSSATGGHFSKTFEKAQYFLSYVA